MGDVGDFSIHRGFKSHPCTIEKKQLFILPIKTENLIGKRGIFGINSSLGTVTQQLSSYESKKER
jgi:hypothetical protein